jgi:hypothetical protein
MVDPHRRKEAVRVGEVKVTGEVKAGRWGVDRLLCDRLEEGVHVPVELRAKGARGELGFVRGDLDGDDDIAFDLEDPATRMFGYLATPSLLVAEVAAIADDGGGLFAELKRRPRRIRPADDQANAPLPQPILDVRQSLKHEAIGPGIGVGVIVR